MIYIRNYGNIYKRYYYTTNITLSNMQSKKVLSIATLNYSGILTSPYEYHENQASSFEYQYGQVFTQIVQEETKQNFQDITKFSWNMGNIDVFWKNRFSPVNWIECGVKPDKKMMTKGQFMEEWEKVRKESEETLKQIYIKKYKSENEAQNMMETQVQRAKIFDYCCYRTIMKVIYGVNDLTDPNIPSEAYLKAKEEAFSKPYLSEQLKRVQTVEMLRSIKTDIFCIQQISEDLLEFLEKDLKDYVITRKQSLCNADTIILFKKECFPSIATTQHAQKLNLQFTEQLAKIKYPQLQGSQAITKVHRQLNWNDKTSFQFVDNILFISPHISSKKQQHIKQTEEMLSSISLIKQFYPKLHIVCAGDFNGPLSEDLTLTFSNKQILKLNVFPNYKTEITSNKKRTLMQPQRNKAEKHDYSAKDFIFSDLPVIECCIMMANQEIIQKQKSPPLLPNLKHPYDHYIVTGKVIIN